MEVKEEENPLKEEEKPLKEESKKIKSKEKKFMCPTCLKKFGRKTTLDAHLVIHEDAKNFPCDRCPYRSKRKGDLVEHIKSRHSNQRPYQCPHCPHRTKTRTNLKHHVRIHIQDKKYSCPLCEYKCVSSQALKIHVSAHSGLKPYKCPTCPFATAYHSSLRGHSKSCPGAFLIKMKKQSQLLEGREFTGGNEQEVTKNEFQEVIIDGICFENMENCQTLESLGSTVSMEEITSLVSFSGVNTIVIDQPEVIPDPLTQWIVTNLTP